MKKAHPKKKEPSSSVPFAEGQKLAGAYVLKQRIESGDAEVWRAYDDVLGKEVSLYFIPAKIAGDAEAMRGLRQEIKRARQLIHPNILRVYDLVADVDWAAISMDAHEGQSLATKLSRAEGRGLDAGALQPWLGQLFQTMDDAHKINVLHRDFSPKNLLLGKDGKLLVQNFGFGRVLADAKARIAGKSDSAAAARSPQQLRGEAATPLDDIYAIGAVLYEALTGQPPRAGKDISEQMLSTKAKSAAPVPESWVTTITACLAEAPEARPQSAGEIGSRLGAVAPVVEAAPVAEPGKTAGTSAAVAASSTETKSAGSSETSDTSKKTEVPAMPTEEKSAPAASPASSPRKSRIPFVGLSLAAAIAAMVLVRDHSIHSGKSERQPEHEPVRASVSQTDEQELRPVSNTLITPLTTPDVAVEESVPAPVSAPTPEKEQVASLPVPPEPVQLAAVSAAAPVAVAAASPAPAPAPAVAAVSPAAQTEEDKLVAEKAAAVEASKQAALAAEKAHADMAKKQQQAAADVAAAEKALEQKAKIVGPVKKAADEVLAQRKKLEDEQKAADLAAEQARQLAEEKARLAAVAQKAIGELTAKNKDKLSAQEKADVELQALQKTLAEKQEAGVGITKAAAEAEAVRKKHLDAIKESEQDLEQAKLAAAEARRLREEAEAERRKLAQELTEMQKMMEKKKAEIEDRLKKLEKPDAKPPIAVPVPETVKPVEIRPAEKPATPAPVVKPVVLATPAPAKPVATPLPATPPPAIAEVKPAPAAPPPSTPAQLVLKTDPEKLPAVSTPKPTVAPGSENSLGMKFVPVGDVEFCIWQTRVKDFEAFAKTAKVSGAWKSPGFKQGPDHPVVNVTWVEALAFCKWLTEQEHKDGTLAASQFYRLPMDVEWSKAVGLPEESGKTPEERDMGIPDVYPWGNQWPPPAKSGNYTGEETGSDVAIKGFDDGYPWTSPVGSFPPNKLGLYDMGGNVWQWCMDTKNTTSKQKVLRGASWYNGALKLSLLSSCRVSALPDSSTDNYGFRVVRAGAKK
ncbi:MAG: SUMF1/EgtB/PvdO family nonheme iron enzyme [Chthoniobacter sp.]|nr:SUMF1/EgtB/PvdO family nonheme iron enzyme [Chthoniobacter sp.]